MFTKSVTASVALSKTDFFLIKHSSESQWTVFLGYLTISTNVRCYYRVFYNNFVFQQDSALAHLAFNTVKLLQRKTLNFPSKLRPRNSPELSSIDLTRWSLAMQPFSITARGCYFCPSSFRQVVPKHTPLVRWDGKTKYILIAYFLSKICDKNYQNRLIYVKSYGETKSHFWDIV